MNDSEKIKKLIFTFWCKQFCVWTNESVGIQDRSRQQIGSDYTALDLGNLFHKMRKSFFHRKLLVQYLICQN